jgi:hypothetical protein
VMGLVVWQQQLFYVNPVAALLGYHFHSATCPAGDKVLIISKRKALTLPTISVAVLSDYLWLDVTISDDASRSPQRSSSDGSGSRESLPKGT